jgi:hypothetical protein
MGLAIAALFSLQIIGTLATPIYLSVRGNMPRRISHYSKKKIIRAITTHFLMMFFITFHFIVILYALLNSQSEVSQQLLFYNALEVVFLSAALYGSGMYIASVLFEMLNKKHSYITRIIHGPISHIIMFGGYLCAFGNLSNISHFTASSDIAFVPWQSLVLLGIIGGYSSGISAISSGIAYIFAIASILIGLFFSLWMPDYGNPFYLHFLGFWATSFTVCMIFIATRVIKRKPFSWYIPINFSKVKLF